MAGSITRVSPKQKIVGGDGHEEIRGIAAFSTTDTSMKIDCPFRFVETIQLQIIGGTNSSETFAQQIALGALSATAAFNLFAPRTGNITGVIFASATTVAANDTNYWTFGLVNKTQTLTPVDNTNNANSTKATGGSGVTAYTGRALTVAAAGQLGVNANDILELTITKVSAATTMNEGVLQVTFSNINTGSEDLLIDDSNLVDGFITRDTNNQITIYRKGNQITSGLSFSFRITGRA